MKYFAFFLIVFSTLFSVEKYSSSYSSDFVFKADLNRRLEHFIPYKGTESRIGVIEINSIDQFSYLNVHRALKKFRKERVSFVLLQIDASGSEFFSALNIAKDLEEIDRKYKIPVIAFIEPKALGSAALIPYACRFIGVVEGGELGGQDGDEVLLSTAAGNVLAETATSFGRNPLVAEAMANPDLHLVLRNGEVVCLACSEQEEPADLLLSPGGELLHLSSLQMDELGVADFVLPEDERVKILAFDEPYLARMPNKNLFRFRSGWVLFYGLILHPVISAVLCVFFVLGALLTFTAQRFHKFSFFSAVCFLLILASSFYGYAVNWYQIAIFMLGLLLLITETLFIAGFGFTGIIGAVLLLIGTLGLFMPELKAVHFTDTTLFLTALFPVLIRTIFLLLGLASGIIIAVVICRRSPGRYFLRKKFIDRGKEAGFIKGLFPGELPAIGETAVVDTSLRPFGTIRYGAEVFDAFCEGHFIEVDQPVEIIAHENGRAKVKEIPLTEV